MALKSTEVSELFGELAGPSEVRVKLRKAYFAIAHNIPSGDHKDEALKHVIRAVVAASMAAQEADRDSRGGCLSRSFWESRSFWD